MCVLKIDIFVSDPQLKHPFRFYQFYSMIFKSAKYLCEIWIGKTYCGKGANERETETERTDRNGLEER